MLLLPAMLLVTAIPSFSQQADSTQQAASEQKDLIDILHAILKKKQSISGARDTSNSHQLRLSLVPAVGYSLQNGFSITLSANGSFSNSNADNQNLSVINAGMSVTQKNQFTIVVQSNIWSNENKINWVGDDRFLIYPQSTYGLGGHTRLTDETVLKYSLIRFSQAVYFKLTGNLYAGGGYALNYHYNIREAVKTVDPESDYRLYDGKTNTTSSGVSINLLEDKRHNLNNPEAGGSYINLQWIHYLNALGSTNNWQAVITDVRKYIGINGRMKNKLALWGYGWFTFNDNAPYLDLPSTGWDMNSNLGRGYIQGRFRGKNLVYAEAEYRMNFTSNGLIGGVLFTNAQSVTDWPSNRFTTLQPAVGTGIRIKFNKHSNTNVALDYAVGTGHSKGLFVNLGEVF